MKRSIKETLIRLVILLVGLIIAHLGVTFFLLANLGSDPFNVLVQGIFRTVEEIAPIAWVTHGRVHIVICFLIILVLLFVDRSYIKIGTLVCMAFGGPIIDFFTMIFGRFFENEIPLAAAIVIQCIACVILAFGMTIVIKSDAGTGPNDLVAVVISDKTKAKFSIVRILVDFSFVIIGFFLGGSFGVGTIICAVLVGPVAGFFMPFNEKNVNRIVALAVADKTNG